MSSSNDNHGSLGDTRENRRRKRNYKRHKSLFNNSSSKSWAGSLTDSEGSTCPAYLVTPRHALISGRCALRTVPGTLSVVFSVHRVRVDRVTLLCGESGGCDLAVTTLPYPLPSSVGILCHPQDYVDRLLGITTGDRLQDMMVQAVRGQTG